MKIIKSLYHKLTKSEFIRYVIFGGIITIVEWILFYFLALILMIYYQLALIISFSVATILHYIFTKIFVFRCKTKKIISQFSLFLVVAIIYLFLSMLLMFVFVELILLHKMISRVLTTGIMFVISYILNKSLTFNKRFFK